MLYLFLKFSIYFIIFIFLRPSKLNLWKARRMKNRPMMFVFLLPVTVRESWNDQSQWTENYYFFLIFIVSIDYYNSNTSYHKTCLVLYVRTYYRPVVPFPVPDRGTSMLFIPLFKKKKVIILKKKLSWMLYVFLKRNYVLISEMLTKIYVWN